MKMTPVWLCHFCVKTSYICVSYQWEGMGDLAIWRDFCSKAVSRKKFVTVVVLDDLPNSLQSHCICIHLVWTHVVQRCGLGWVTWTHMQYRYCMVWDHFSKRLLHMQKMWSLIFLIFCTTQIKYICIIKVCINDTLQPQKELARNYKM